MLLFYVSVAYVVINSLLAIIVYFKSRRNLLTQFYVFCVGCLVLLAVTGYLLSQPLDDNLRVVLRDIAVFLYSLLPFFFLHLAVIFSRRYDILKSKTVIMAIYVAGLFSYTMVLLGFVATPISPDGRVSPGGNIFFVTWMSIFFSIGVALLYSLIPGFKERRVKTNLLLVGLAALLLLLPGPFTESIVSTFFPKSVQWYFLSSIAALTIAVYLVFRHKIIINTPYEVLKSTLAVMNDILIKTNEKFEIELVQGAFSTLLGYAERDMHGRSLLDLVEERNHLEDYRDSVLQGKMRECSLDSEVICKNGERIPMNFSFAPVFAGGDQLDGFVTIAIDLSSRRRAEEELHQSEEQFRLIAENVEDLIAVLDLEGRRLYSSPSYKDILGNPAQLRGTDSFKDIHADDRERIRSIFQETVRTQVGRRVEYRLLCKDGKTRFIESQGSVIRDTDQEAAKVVVVSRDITEKKKLEEQLRRVQKMESIGTLAGGIAHDFNNILQIILVNNTRLQRLKNDPTKVDQILETNVSAIERGTSLVQQILTFARKTDVLFQPLDLDPLIKEMISMVSGTFPKIVSISFLPHQQLPLVTGDHTQINQVLLNLLVNARDAMPSGGNITLSTGVVPGEQLRPTFTDADQQRYVRITVADTGHGMDEQTRNRIFEPFFTTKEKGKGTGLGLAVVYGIIKAHHGFIDIDTAPRAGTTFHIYLPAPTNVAAMPKATSSQSQEVTRGSGTILIVEDEALILSSLVETFEESGYHVLSARDGLEAVETYRGHSNTIDLVVTDLGLPQLSGWDAFLKMREVNPHLRVVILSGYFDPAMKAAKLGEGVCELILKPCKPEEVLSAVRRLLTN